MFGLSYEGLKKKETFDEIVDYLMNKQENIEMPNRVPKQLRNSSQCLTSLMGMGRGFENGRSTEKSNRGS